MLTLTLTLTHDQNTGYLARGIFHGSVQASIYNDELSH